MTRNSRLATRSSSRRGVLLLVVLGMLTLFLLIGTAFIVSSNQYRRSEKSLSKFSEQENLRQSQEGFLGEVIYQLIRDTNNQNSALRFHSLLRDLYGTEGLVAPSRLGVNSTVPEENNANFNFAGMNPLGSSPAPGNVTNGQFLEFTLANNFEDLQGNAWVATNSAASNYKPYSAIDNYYSGLLLTFLSGPAAGHTTRIVGSFRIQQGAQPALTDPTLIRILNFPAENGQSITSAQFLTSLNGSKILINGRPFNGTGVGYDPTVTAANAPKLSAQENVLNVPATVATPIALMPNAAFFEPGRDPTMWTVKSPVYYGLPASATTVPLSLRQYDGLGGSDESYDAPDFQNMFLGWTGPNVADTNFTSLDGTTINGTTYNRSNVPPFLGNIVIPSFHRPDMLNYWANQFLPSGATSVWESTLADSGGVDLLRKVMLRPNWHDHPDFTGSNPEYAATGSGSAPRRDKLLRMIYGPWDVDNDNDGVRDSVWVDFGAPVMMDQKGRLVKPLAAIMVLDMDGRLNVNAHGTRELAGIGNALEQQPFDNPAGMNWNNVPRGQGFGTAEIDLIPVLYQPIPNPDITAPDRFQEPYTTGSELRAVRNELAARLMRGAFAGNFANLEDGLDASGNSVAGSGKVFAARVTGRYSHDGSNDDEPGRDDLYDLSTQLKMQGYPVNLPQRSNFGSLPDLRARYKSALNNFGQFVTTWTANDSNLHSLVIDNPYEMDVSTTGSRGTGTAVDSPYSLAEFERILRAFDVDAGTLPSRLYELAGEFRMPAEIDSSQSVYLQMLNDWRTLLTTDSFDLPEPSFQLPEWVKNGPDGIPGDFVSASTNVAGYDDYGFVMSRGTDPVLRRNPINATYVDLIEYRVLLELFRRTNPANPQPRQLTADEELLVRSSIKALVAPEMLRGLKLDLNRPFGNGRDDDGNGVVDEPGEIEVAIDNDNDGLIEEVDGDRGALWSIDDIRSGVGATIASSAFEFSQFRDDLDRNGNGTIEPWERGDTDGDGNLSLLERVNLANYRRQLLARYLYAMGMAVTDPLPPLDVNGLNATIKNRKIKEYRRDIAARAEKMAQWAINVVDFRDADNIMTPFEYDVYPFAISVGIGSSTPGQLYSTWGVDGDIRTSTDLPNWSDNGSDDNANNLIDRADVTELADRNSNVIPGFNGDDDGDGLVDFDDYDEVAERQLVWGMERPELVMTETLAWHDRATEDLAAPFSDDSTDENLDQKMDDKDEGQVGVGNGNFDRDFDQMFKPQGATFIELYNPWAASPGASADTHLIDPSTGNDLGITLARTHDNSMTGSPVWRIDVRKTVDYNKTLLNPQLGLYVGGPDHDPDDPDYRVQPQIPDRSIYFTPFDPERYFPIKSTTMIPKWQTAWDDDGVAFYSSLTNPTAPVDQNDPTYVKTHAVVRPGGYMVVGSGIPVDSGGTPIVPADPTGNPNANGNVAYYEARVGDKKKGTDERHAVILNPNATGAQPSVWIRSKTGTPLQDQAGFMNSATASTTSVAIIDSIWFRNISKSSAAVTAENWEYRRFSVSEPATGYPLAAFASYFKGAYYNDPNGYYQPALDIPLDNQRWGRYQYTSGNIVDGQTVLGITSPKWTRKSGPNDKTATLELQKDSEMRLTLPEKEQQSVRTIPAFSWLYLQRLANPMLPWNPAPGHQKHRPVEPVNPYMTVDSMAVNVTVFNGREISEKRIQDGVERDYGNNYAIRTFASLQRGRNNEAIVEALLGRIREAQGAAPEPNGSGLPQKVTDTGFRNMKVNAAMSTGMILEPQANGQGGGQPVAGSPQNLWGEERIGLVDKQYVSVDASFKKPFGMWMNRAGAAGDGLYKEAVSGSHFFHSLPDCTLGFLNEPYRNEQAATPLDKQFIPTQPFPLIAWNNRPFANSAEILQVPAFRSSQLPKVFSFSKGQPPATPVDVKGNFAENYLRSLRIGNYPKVLVTGQTDTDAVDSKVAFPEIRVDGPFGHLLNFFRTRMFNNLGADNTFNTTDDLQWNQGFAGLYRVLDLIEVPSRFVGTETWLSPIAFGAQIPNSASTSDPRYGFQPPFNRIRSRREPGRVNINTIAAEAVWNALFHGDVSPNPGNDVHPGPSDNELAASRRGYGLADNKDPTWLSNAYPTIFSNPFRNDTDGDLVPLSQMVLPGVDCTLNRHSHPIKGNDGLWGTGDVDDDMNGVTDDISEQGLGADASTAPIPQVPDAKIAINAALTAADTNNSPFTLEQLQNKYRDSNRNPYFRYSPISRLSSMTTNRSNVFAVWVTIGFFEVHEINDADDGVANNPNGILSRYGGSMLAMQSNPVFRATFNRVYPDGYSFGKEAGIDTGETVRYREFAIIDRTIPVGFEPGANHNAKETIRLQRKIE